LGSKRNIYGFTTLLSNYEGSIKYSKPEHPTLQNMTFYHFFVGLFEAGRDPDYQYDPDSDHNHNKIESESETLYTGKTQINGKLMLLKT